MKSSESKLYIRYFGALGALAVGLTMFIYPRNMECEATLATATDHVRPSLSVHLKTNKIAYSLADAVVLHIRITNSSGSPIYIYKVLDMGRSAGLSVWVKDAMSGADVPIRFIPDALPPPPRSKDEFAEILPHQSYVVDLPCTMRELNILTNGVYELTVEYRSPIPRSMSFGLPIWSNDKGSIRSNSVKIAVDH